MEIISHRRNTIAELVLTEKKYGVEVDIRTDNGRLVIHHDPCKPGESFEEWIAQYQHGTLILNVKEEGLESYLIPLMKPLRERSRTASNLRAVLIRVLEAGATSTCKSAAC